MPDAAIDSGPPRLPADAPGPVARPVPPVPAATPRGVPGHALLTFAGCLPVAAAEEMLAAIEAGCGRADAGGW